MTELANLHCFRHQLVQTLKELVELGLVADDGLDSRSRIDESVEKSDFVSVFI